MLKKFKCVAKVEIQVDYQDQDLDPSTAEFATSTVILYVVGR